MLEEEMREVNEEGMKSFDALDSREKTMTILGDRWWPLTRCTCQIFLCNIRTRRNERLNVGGVSMRSKNGAPSQKGDVVDGHTIKASEKHVVLSSQITATMGRYLTDE